MAHPHLFAAALLWVIASPACANPADGLGQEMGIAHLPVLAGTEYIRHHSILLDRDFHLHVNVPDGLPAEARLPVIYLLDGDQTFPLLASYSYYLTFEEEMEPAILVGISYGTTDPATNRRITDFTAPAADNADYGGADQFLQALEEEIVPQVERGRPVDPQRRVLVGQSLGGQFALHAALRRPGVFGLVIAVNPALHRNLEFYLGALGNVPSGRQQRLYVSSAEFDDERFRVPALEWMQQAQAHKPAAFCLKTESLPDETHLSSLPRAFRNAMRWQKGAAGTCR